jgi:polyisoprenoid-binding protein YceI
MNARLDRRQVYRSRRVARLAVGLALWGAVLASSRAAEQPTPQPSTQRATPPDGSQIDVKRSRVYVRVGKLGLGHEHGVEGRFKSGWLRLDAADNAGELIFDLSTFTADTAAARKYVSLPALTDAVNPQVVTQTLRGHEVLDVQKHPTATYIVRSSKAVMPAAGEPITAYELDGDFDLHGVRRPLKVQASIQRVESALRVHGRFVIKQSDFGIKPYTKFLGTVRVADELTIWGDAWLPATAAK